MCYTLLMNSENVNDQQTINITPENTPKKGGKGPLIGLVVFLLLACAGLGGFLIYHFVTTDHTVANKDCSACQNSSGDNTSSDSWDISNVKAEVDKIVSMESGSLTMRDAFFPLVAINNGNSYTPAEMSYGAMFDMYSSDSAKALEKEEQLKADLISIGFSEFGAFKNAPFYVVGDGTYEKGNIICAVGQSPYAYIACSEKDWVSNETNELATQLSNAYYAKVNSYPLTIRVSNPTIKDSSVSPYQTLQVGTDNAAGLFYRVSPDAEWQYFTSTQAELECSEYNTDDIRKAYAGDKCYDEAAKTDKTVQP